MVVVAVVCSGLVVGSAGPAAARKVSNPGTGFVLKVQSGFLRIRDNSFDFDDEGRVPQCQDGSNNDGGQDGAIDFPADGQCTSATDDSETQGGFQPKLPIQMTNGTVTAAGAVTFPAANVSFPTQYLWVDAPSPVNPFVVTINIIPTHDVTGTINAITGAVSLRIRVRVTLSGGPLAGGCAVGSAASPIDVNTVITGTTAPPGPNTPISGTPYNPATGRALLVNNSFSVPGAQGCGTYALFVDMNDQINSNLGLPSPAGNNEAQFTTEFIGTRPQAGVVASFTTTPSSGPAPLNVAFNAAASQGLGLTYQWDFTNNGTFDASGATTSFNYASPGAFTARLRVTDSDGDIAETTRLVSVGTNLPPTAGDQSVSTAEDTAKSITLSGTDPEGLPLTFALAAPAPAHGTVTGTPPNVVYTPAANDNGPDSFGFRVTDNNGGTDTGLVTINVTAVNDAPVATNVGTTTVEDTATTVALAAADADGDALTYAVVTQPTRGAVTCTPGGSCTYTPDADANGTDTFTFDAVDPSGARSNVATATVTITPVNDAPVATDQTVATDEDTATSITLAGTDVDGGTLSFSIVTLPSSGVVSGSPPNLTYTPAANFNGTTSFTFRATDSSGASDVGTVDVVVGPVNDAPVASDASVGTTEDASVTVNIVAADGDGDPLTFEPTTPTAGGGTVICAGNACTYTPAAGFTGEDSFDVLVDDGQGGTDTATVSVTVSSVENTPPVVNDATVVVIEDTARNFAVASSDADGDPRTLTVLVAPADGTLTCSGAGACTYTPAPNATGDRTAVVRVSDGRGGIDDATITLRIAPANDVPVATAADVSTEEDTAAVLQLVASDPDGDTLSWTVKRAPAHGTLSCTTAGACTYTPAADYHGTDSFEVEVDDAHGGRARSTVPVTVSSVNDPPRAGNVTATVVEDGGTVLTLTGTDVDGDALTFSAGPGTLGALACSAAGTCTYAPDDDRNGVDTATYTVSDGTAAAGGTVAVVIVPVNDAPTAPGLTLTTDEDSPVSFTLPGGDADASDTLSFTLTSAPPQGSLSGVAPNLTYVPGPQASGSVAFGYSVVDAAGASASGTVTIVVAPVDDAPVATSRTVTTPEDTPLTLTLGGTDEEGPVTVSITDPPDHGTYNGSTYIPVANYNGADSIGFTVHDSLGQTAAGVATITVVPTNDAPVAFGSAVSTTRTTPVGLTLGATDIDGDALTFTVLTGPGHGSLTGTAPNLTYTPAGLYAGPDAFTFRVTDPSGATSSATVNVTVNQGAPLATQLVASPATVTRPGGLLGFLSNYTYNNLSGRLSTTGGNIAVAGRQVRFVVQGTLICAATTGPDGRATCSGQGPRVASSTYQAQFLGDAQFAASTATGALS
ncbi:MAG: tandem-95 repeat protein [Acidimicrobiia bacterium]|nr:tandem-95 repeat protein [Acidimicrobiia bacterium]